MQALTMSISESTQENVVVLISCVSKKADTADGPVIAKNLYLSPLFIKSLEYANKILGVQYHRIFIIILAGKSYYQYLIGDDRITDYELPLGKRPIGQRLNVLNSAISKESVIK